MADSQRKTANLFDYLTMADGQMNRYLLPDGTTAAATGVWAITDYIPIDGNAFTLKRTSGGNAPAICLYNSNKNYLTGMAYNGDMTVTISSSTTAKYARFSYLISAVNPENLSEVMLNEGNTPLPYEPYGWHHSLRKLTTATDTLTTLPADLYADGNNTTVGILGNMQQTGTPTPQNPIQPSECGDLETTDEHAGQYKIPILSANTTTNVYLGEVETERKIKKLVLTGEETYVSNTKNNEKSIFQAYMNLSPEGSRQPQDVICTHLPTEESATWTSQRQGITMRSSASGIIFGVAFDVIGTTTSETAAQANTKLKEWLAQQYANGTPVTVWYVLTTPTTGIVNEPLRKIGDYADAVSGVSIPTTTGKDVFNVETTLKPSEVSLSYTGWHDATVKEWDGSEWQ